MNDFLSTYTGKKVFITGHTGFKGSWLGFLLKELGATVRGFALAPETEFSLFELLHLQNNIDHCIGDIRDATSLKKAIDDFQPEFVFHLAAQAIVTKSYDDPVKTFDTNIMGSVNLLDAVKQCESVKSLVYITSDKCYENVEWLWGYRENDRLGGHDPYSASKAAAEIVFSAYARSFFSLRPDLGAATTRAGNVIGGGDWSSNRLIPDCLRAIKNNLPVKLRNPSATRPWQHVLEPISGYLQLGHRLFFNPDQYSGSWNFGPSATEIRTVEEVVTSLINHLGRGSIELEENNQKIHEATLLQLNCEKAKQLLDWAPRWDVERALKATGDWYKVFLKGGSIKDISRKQLNDYFKELV